MGINWRGLGVWWATAIGVFLFLLTVSSGVTQILTLKNGRWLLVSLFVVTLLYMGVEALRKFRNRYRALQTRLDEVRDFILRSGEPSTVVLLCAQARWLYQHQGQSIRVSELQSERIVTLDVSQVPLRPNDNLVGMHFSIIGFNKGEIAQGTVQLCDSTHACIELYEKTEAPRAGDLAIPIEPPEATVSERLLGNILFIASNK